MPLQVIGFSQDMQVPPGLGRIVAELAPLGEFHLLEGLAHLSMVGHRADLVNEKIRAILTRFEYDDVRASY